MATFDDDFTDRELHKTFEEALGDPEKEATMARVFTQRWHDWLARRSLPPEHRKD